MKYGRIVYGYNSNQSTKNQYANIGDFIQTFAIDEVYKRLNIPQNEIVNIPRQGFNKYNETEAIVPMQGWFGYIKGMDIFPIPNLIKPVFVGFNCVDKRTYHGIDNVKKFTPIGCRDEKTWQILRDAGINAYISGCLTTLLPCRQKLPEKEKVFLVDVPIGLSRYIPEKIKECSEVISHEIPVNCQNDYHIECFRLELLSRELLERYKQEATLVVTSRLHCASPCMAMGIPVILVRDYFDYRYAWIDRFLHLYTPEEFSQIDWNPPVVDLEEHKQNLFELTKSAIQGENIEEKSKAMHDFFMNRTRGKISVPLRMSMYHYLHGYFPKFADFIREVILSRFTVATGRNSQRHNSDCQIKNK